LQALQLFIIPFVATNPKQHNKHPFKFGIPERKILLFFIYNAVFAVIGISALSGFARKADLFQSELVRYFTCEFNGHNPLNPCDRSIIEGIEPDGVTIMVYIIGGSLPIVNLIFVISIKDVKKRFMSLCGRVKTLPTTQGAVLP
jgi:hypothetical protein